MRGVSMVELLVTFAIILIISSFGTPSLVRTYKSLKLTDAASQVVGVLNMTRLEAVRQNTQISCQIRPYGPGNGTWQVWADSNKNGVPDVGEKWYISANTANLLPAGGVPNAGALNGAAGIANPTVLSGGAGTITYDSRGAVAPPTVYVMFIGNPSDPNAGYRAVVLMASGIAHVWTTNGNGPWTQVS